ncbi:predicted protein [Chaetoceros tenuissimus]|uniref:Uncharacterized protein n=1 Tax=Chaetoceros tenuissimus TaxID=426638 RepID=A0AAD3H388_9STRA|nr:predicted protein [Chaetoceros tenuissimus]
MEITPMTFKDMANQMVQSRSIMVANYIQTFIHPTHSTLWINASSTMIILQSLHIKSPNTQQPLQDQQEHQHDIQAIAPHLPTPPSPPSTPPPSSSILSSSASMLNPSTSPSLHESILASSDKLFLWWPLCEEKYVQWAESFHLPSIQLLGPFDFLPINSSNCTKNLGSLSTWRSFKDICITEYLEPPTFGPWNRPDITKSKKKKRKSSSS